MLLRLLRDPALNAKAWYVWYFASLVSIGPYVNIYFQQLGLSKTQVGLIGALRPWTSAPASFLWAALADRLNAHRAVLLGTFVASVVLRVLLLLPRGFAGLLAVTLLAEVASAPVGVLADASVMHVCGKESEYGKFRLWGAVGWGAFSTPAGWLITHLGIKWAFYTNAVLSLPCLLHGARLQHHATRKTAHLSGGGAAGSGHDHEAPAGTAEAGAGEEDPLVPLKADPLPEAVTHRSAAGAGSQQHGDGNGIAASSSGDAGGAVGEGYWRKLWTLARRPEVAVFFVTATAMGYGFGTIDSFLFLYLGQMGASETLMGLTLTITCAAEVPAFQLQDRLLDRWGVTAVLDLTMAVYVLRLGLYALLPYLGSVLWVLPVEVLHGVTFACGWGAGTVNCKTLAPPGLAATLQGAFQGLYFGAGYGLGSLVGGWVGSRVGWQGMFAVASATMAVFWVGVLAARQLLGVTLSGRAVKSGYVELSSLTAH